MAHSSQLSQAVKACLLIIALTLTGLPAVSAQSPAAQSFRELLDRSEK
jgi:hypothetical protein